MSGLFAVNITGRPEKSTPRRAAVNIAPEPEIFDTGSKGIPIFVPPESGGLTKSFSGVILCPEQNGFAVDHPERGESRNIKH